MRVDGTCWKCPNNMFSLAVCMIYGMNFKLQVKQINWVQYCKISVSLSKCDKINNNFEQNVNIIKQNIPWQNII